MIKKDDKLLEFIARSMWLPRFSDFSLHRTCTCIE